MRPKVVWGKPHQGFMYDKIPMKPDDSSRSQKKKLKKNMSVKSRLSSTEPLHKPAVNYVEMPVKILKLCTEGH